MDAAGWTSLLLLLSACWLAAVGVPIGNTINCNGGGNVDLGEVEEGYSGDVELVTGVAAGSGVKLVPFIFPAHLEFLELSFTLGDANATVRTRKALDADRLGATDSTLYYSIMCDGPIKYNNSRTLKVRDLNDNRPVFSAPAYTASVSEAQSVDSEVLRVTATDADSTSDNNVVTYSFTPASDDFIVSSSGAFILKRRLNYNVVKSYNFTVRAEDSGGLFDTANVLIEVVDFDNLNPFFIHNLYRAFIAENQEGTFPTVEPEAIKAMDGDVGINRTLSYTIVSVSPDKYMRNFAMDPNNGVLSVTAAFDREEMSSDMISVNIQAAQTDDPLKTAAAVVSVTVEDVNDIPPQFDQPDYTQNLLENSPEGAVLFKAVVTDLDQGGFVGNLTLIPESVPFSIDSDGTVRVKNSQALDHESTQNFTFQIEATEAEPPHMVAVAPVTVVLLDENDNSPVFSSSSYTGKVFANQTEGMLLVQVLATDADSGRNGQVEYSIDFGNNHGYFELNVSTGALRLVKPIPLLENRVQEFTLFITARDGGTISRSSSVQVNIRAPGDSKPQFLQEVYRGTVQEEQDPGQVVVKVDFLALPTEVPVTLQVVTEGDKFSISQTGVVTTNAKLDFDEGPHNYSVSISISDGSTTNSAVVEVQVTDINDNSPVFASNPIEKSLPEDADVGSNVTMIQATDKDSSFNKEVRYSLRGGGGKFSIDPMSGMVSLVGGLDRETEAEYNLQVLAEDQGRPARTASATLLVQVLDVNDNTPKFSEVEYQVEVWETESVGVNLLNISAVDPDQGTNGIVTYSIFQQSPDSDSSVFELDAASGALRLVGPLDYSRVQMYTLTVQATDGGTPPLSGRSSVVVRVKDVNNNPPEFSKESYKVAVSENLAGGASILTLEVSDKDQGGFSNGFFHYDNNTFDISQQGVVSLRKDVTLDRETKDNYILQVVAVDQLTDGLSATAQLNITVLDYNDNSPQFLALPDPVHFPEGDYSEETPGVVLTIVATDADLGSNGEVSLSLASPHPLFKFTEDGTLLAVGVLDRESQEVYDLVIKASDKGSPQRENITTVSVHLTDVNDNPPEFSADVYVKSILRKDAEEGKQLLMLSATDKDIGDNSLITYSFSSGASPYLALDGDTGEVTLTSDLADLMEDTTLELTAMAQDRGRPPLNSTARVLVNLRLFNLVEGVAFQSSSYNFSLLENRPAGASLGQVVASAGSNIYQVAYALNTHSDLFSVNGAGAIVTKTPLDKEMQQWYILEVEASDTRDPPTTATAVVRVEVEDVNEAPRFPHSVYKASVYSIAPYKTPLVQVKASDPDVGDEGELVYSLSAASPHFDVEASSGQVLVVSVEGLAGQTVAVEVKASDPGGLRATTTVEVVVQGSVSSSDVVFISLNQPANVVEQKVPDLEKALAKALGWSVGIIQVSSVAGSGSASRAAREAARALVSFVAVEGGEAVSFGEVTEKLQQESAAVRAELATVFGDGLHFDVQVPPQLPASDQALTIALGVLLGLTTLGLVIAAVFLVRFKRMENQDDKKSLMDRSEEGHAIPFKITYGPQKQMEPHSHGRGSDVGKQRRASDGEDAASVKCKTTGADYKHKDEGDDGSRTSSL